MDLEVWLLRHAEAAPESPTGRDRDRALTEHGQQTCIRLRYWLADYARSHRMPKTIFYSPAKRTQQTIEAVVEDLALPTPQSLDALWAASAGELVDIISQHKHQPDPLWLVGHNPGLSDVVSWLATDLPWPGMKPGTLVRLGLSSKLHPREGQILEVIQAMD